MMATTRKYPKSFYDDGLGDFLEWIDDEVLINSDRKVPRDEDSTPNQNAKSKKKSKDNKPGNVKKKNKLYGENDVSEEKYKAPKRLKFMAEEDEEQGIDKRLEERARGLINRLAAQTMPFVTSEFEKLYATNQRLAVDMAILEHLKSSIIARNALTKRKLVAEFMLMVSYLSFKVSKDTGAFIVHRLVERLENSYKTDKEDTSKVMENILLCLINLYIIGMIDSNLILDIAKRICSAEDFRPKSVELLLLMINSVGFQLRKDNPSMMRQLIIMTQDRCKILKSDHEVGARIEFMMESLGAIKNNNIAKLGNYGCDIDKDTIESTLKSLIKRTKMPECLGEASYEEVLHSANWYLLETRVAESDEKSTLKSTTRKESVSKTDEKISKALGLNKPAEKTILSALLRASDFVEASNVIISFGLNHCSDAMLVCVHVAIHEKKYNQFHFNLINNLCKFNRKYKMAAKFSIQDKIRVLGRMPAARVAIFKTLCLELIKSDAIPITILKSIEWADLSSSTREYLVHILENISELDAEEKRKIMSKVEEKSSFAGAMRTFINCFLKGCKLFH